MRGVREHARGPGRRRRLRRRRTGLRRGQRQPHRVQPRRGHPLTARRTAAGSPGTSGFDPRRALQDERRRTGPGWRTSAVTTPASSRPPGTRTPTTSTTPRGPPSPSSAPRSPPWSGRPSATSPRSTPRWAASTPATTAPASAAAGHRAGPAGGTAGRPDLRRLLSRRRSSGAGRDGQSRVSRRWVTRCGRAASTPSRSTLFAS